MKRPTGCTCACAIQLGALIRKATRTSDLAVRIGGEEFLIVYVDTSLGPASDAAQLLCVVVQDHAWAEMQAGLSVTASLGMAAWSGGESFQRWYERIDAALYAAKREGRNRVVRAPEARAAAGCGRKRPELNPQTSPPPESTARADRSRS
jgi:diguanylate cyclase (GGDEF)-like protein